MNKIVRNISLFTIVFLMAINLNPVNTRAQEKFPSKTIEMVSHAGIGGGTDVFVRMISLKARRILKTDIAVVTKTGGVGASALNYVNSRPRDGYTVFALLPGHLMTIARGNSPIGLDKIVPLVRGCDEPNLLMVKGDGPFKSVQDLVAEGEKRKIKFAGGHIGAIDHIASFLFAKRAGMKQPLYVPFKGGAGAVTSLIAGDVEVAVANLSEAESQVTSGDIRPVVVLAKERLKPIPNVPTSYELGINAGSSVLRGLGVLKGTPENRIAVLEKAFLKSMQSKEYQSYLKGAGMDETSILGREEWSKVIQEVYENSTEILKDLGMIK